MFRFSVTTFALQVSWMQRLVSLIDENEVLQLSVALNETPNSIQFVDENSKRTLLHHACHIRDVSEEIPRLLVLLKADINAQDKEGLTPLHYSCSSGNWKVCKMLLTDTQINTKIKANDQLTPFAYAVNYKTHKIPSSDLGIYSEILRELGIPHENQKCKDKLNNTTLHLAVNQSNKIALEHILTSGISPDQMNE